jgi:glutamate racemase
MHVLATPSLVPLIESGKCSEATDDLISLIEDKVGEIDTLILGCTHYTLLKEQIRKYFGSRLKVISQDEIIPEKLKLYLERHPEIENKLSRSKAITITLSRENEMYDRIKRNLIGV